MKRYRFILIGMVLAAFLFTLCACSTPAGRTAGTVIDDGTVSTKVKTKLIRDDFLRGLAISVETFQGEVTLTGAVNNQQEKERAEKLAAETPGVKKVNNLLKIK